MSEDTRQLPLDVRWRRAPTFTDFVTEGNFEAVAAVVGSATARAAPVFLHGASGSGKTHLLQAATRLAHDRGRRAVYLPPGIAAEALDGYAAFDVVAVDDCLAVPDSRHLAVPLVRLMDALATGGGNLLMASRTDLAALAGSIPADLHTRLARCSVYALQPLSDAALREALQRQARLRGLSLGDDTGDYLIRRLPRDMHTLMAALDRLDQASLSAQHRLTIPFVQRVLSNWHGARAPTSARTGAG
ncbi:MAG TPA: DnaA/Hda family protein [Nevskiaceae bacterium]